MMPAVDPGDVGGLPENELSEMLEWWRRERLIQERRVGVLQERMPLNVERDIKEGHIHFRQLGYVALAKASSPLTLGTSNADVAGCTLTLPHVGVYNIDAVFDFFFDAVPDSAGATDAVGVLTDSGDTEVDSPRAALFGVTTLANNDDSRGTWPQQWVVTTTAKDTVYKLRARKSRIVTNEVVKAMDVHTTIRATYIGRAVA